MTQDQRLGRWAGAFDMIEMDVDVFDARGELREAIERLFLLVPVVAVDPVAAERAHKVEIGAVGPCFLETWSARHLMPFIGAHLGRDGVECGLGNLDLEWLGHGASPLFVGLIRNVSPYSTSQNGTFFALASFPSGRGVRAYQFGSSSMCESRRGPDLSRVLISVTPEERGRQ